MALEFNSLEDAVKHIASEGYVVRTADEESTYLENYKKDELKKTVSEFYQNFDNKLKENGFEKNDGEKTYDAVIRILNNEKNSLADITAKYEGLEKEKINEQSVLQGYKDQIQAIKDTSKKEQDKLLDQIKMMQRQAFESSISNEVNKSVATIRSGLKSDIFGLDEIIENRISKFYKQFEAKPNEDNILIWYNKETNKPELDPKTLSPVSLSVLLAERFEDLKDTGRNLRGNGHDSKQVNRQENSQNVESNANQNENEYKLELPEEIKTRTQLREYLIKQGYKLSTFEGMKYYTENSKDLPLKQQ